MQSSLYFASNPPPYFPFPWKPHKIRYLTPSHKPIKPSLKLLTLSNSLKTSFDSEFQEEKLHKPEEPTWPVPLPLVLRRSGSVSRYIWDGNELKFVSLDKNSVSLSSLFSGNGFQKLFSICSLGVRKFFLPQEVTRNYLEYIKWKFLHRVFSSALQVLATQAMFRAIGVGYTRALPSAAALNWVLKDGLGRLSRCVFTASLASAFDTNLKRVRFSTSVLFSLSIGVELLTPAFPQYFLLLATIANVAKQISLACYLATGTAVHRSFAVADNLGEVSAKAQIQTVCFDNLGLMLAAALNIIFRNNQRLQAGLPFVVYPIFSAFDLIGIYHGLKHVHLQTLTKQILSSPTPPTLSFYYRGLRGAFWSSLEKEPLEDRLEIVINKWIQLGCVPSPADVSKEEGIDFMRSNGRGLWPIRIGCLNAKSQIPRLSMMTMRSLKDEDTYFICLENLCSGFTATSSQGIVLCMREGAGTSDVIMGLLQACHIRKAILSCSCRWEENLEACYDSDSAVTHWFKLVKDCKQCAQLDFNLINQQMLGVGWACKNILLSTQEQARYGFVHERENCTDATAEKFF